MRIMKRIISAFVLVVMILTFMSVSAKEDISITEKKAEVLSCLNILKGDEYGFRLNDVSTRLEAIIIFIRLTGNEKDALEKNLHHPFVDVPQWASPYVGYAYAIGITSGVDEKNFGTDEMLTVNQFLTFVLRTLGYSDKNGDFNIESAIDFAYSKNIITSDIDADKFNRSDITIILYDILGAKIKDTKMTFDKKLKALGVFSEDDEIKAAKIIAEAAF